MGTSPNSSRSAVNLSELRTPVGLGLRSVSALPLGAGFPMTEDPEDAMSSGGH